MRWRNWLAQSGSARRETNARQAVLGAVARYFFHLHECGVFIPDEEGQELDDAEAARRQAVLEARHVMAAEVQTGKLCLSCRIEVVDETQRPVLAMPFKAALELSGL
jgi:hypothetical protein